MVNNKSYRHSGMYSDKTKKGILTMLTTVWFPLHKVNQLDTVRTVYHLVIYMQPNKIHKVF